MLKRCIVPAAASEPVEKIDTQPVARFDFEADEIEREQDRARLAEALVVIQAQGEQLAALSAQVTKLVRTVVGISDEQALVCRVAPNRPEKASAPADVAKPTGDLVALQRQARHFGEQIATLIGRVNVLDRRTRAISTVAAPAGAPPKPGTPVTPLPTSGMFEDDPRAVKPEPRLRMLPEAGSPGCAGAMCVDAS